MKLLLWALVTRFGKSGHPRPSGLPRVAAYLTPERAWAIFLLIMVFSLTAQLMPQDRGAALLRPILQPRKLRPKALHRLVQVHRIGSDRVET